MGKIKDNKKIGFITAFISSEKGQRFFNFAYSIGAAVVIWGALFKILHLPGGNALLSIGMGTEVLMFLLTAFDRPPREYKWEEVFPALNHQKEGEASAAEANGAQGGVILGGSASGTTVVGGSGIVGGVPADGEGLSGTTVVGGGPGGVIIAGGGVIGGGIVGSAGNAAVNDAEFIDDQPGTVTVGQTVVAVTPEQARRTVGIPDGLNLSEEQTTSLTESIAKMAAAADQLSRMAELTSATQTYLDQMSAIATEMQRLHDVTNSLNNVSEVLLKSYEAITQHSNEINDSSTGYVEQMQSLNRNIGGLNTIYEIQLKSVSSQLDAIDRVNRGIKDIRDMYEKSAEQSSHYCEETEKMARYMKQLNQVYEKMITAMTINMYRSGMPPTAEAADQDAEQ